MFKNEIRAFPISDANHEKYSCYLLSSIQLMREIQSNKKLD